ncbi:MAG: S24 family peptidase [Bacteroidaceae bacterium]|nr:S24 family peptidase [Bacteroidaceae bacterium]
MKDNGIKQRVVEVLRFKKINVNRASKILDIPQRTLNRQVNEDGNISMDLLYAILDTFTEISPLWLLLGEGDIVASHAEPTLNKVPYYNDLPVSAGFKDVLDGGNETPTSYISIPGRNADFFFPVSGTSMEPEINDGDIVGVKRVGRSEGIVHGDVYMVVTNDNRMIKRCYHDNNDPNLIWCVSPNYPSFPIHKNDVCALFKVVNRIETF